MEHHTLYLLAGSNQGDKERLIGQAADMINSRIGTVTSQSSLYETEPWGFSSEEFFLNRAFRVSTSLSPEAVMQKIHEIEKQAGRERSGTGYVSRTLDIDILFYDDLVLEGDGLTIPHPRLQDRRFVLVPLAAIAQELVHPVSGKTIGELLRSCSDDKEVRIFTAQKPVSYNLMKYNFIAIEGNIGAGKTSLAARISQDFNGKLILEQFEDNAFLPKFYENAAKYAFPLELSFLASRYQQLKDQLTHQDLFRSFTIADYFIHKSMIFAGKTLDGDELALYTRLFKIIEASLPRPDLLVYLYVSIARLKSNILKRGRPYEQNIDFDYLEKIQAGYLEFLRQQQSMRILIIDTNKVDFVNRREDYDRLISLIGTEYEPGITRVEA